MTASTVGGLRSADCYSEDGVAKVMFAENNNDIVIAAGFNGGGFKMAPAVGKQVLELFNKRR